MAPKTNADKLAELLSTFDKDELAQVLTENLSADTRRAIKAPKASSPEKLAIFAAVATILEGENMDNVVKLAADSASRSCTITGDAPEGIDSGSGDNYDRFSISFRFNSPKIRADRKAARENEEGE